MKRILAILLTLSLFAAILGAAVVNQPMVRISVDEVYRYLCSTEDYLVLDLRRVSDYKNGHIIGAVSADMDKAMNGDYEDGKATMKRVLKEETGRENGNGKILILACYTGNRYAQAATNVLSMIGADMSRVFTLEGGNTAWNASRYQSLVTTEEGVEVLSRICLFDPNDATVLKEAEPKAILLDDFDFSSRVGNSTLSLEDIADLFSITTPCAFEQASVDSGYTLEMDGDDVALVDPKTKEWSIKRSDKWIEVRYNNGKKAVLSRRWPEGQGIADVSTGNALLLYTVYNEDLTVIVFRKTDETYRNALLSSLKNAFPLEGNETQNWNGESGAVSYQGQNQKGETVLFVYSASFKGVCLEKK